MTMAIDYENIKGLVPCTAFYPFNTISLLFISIQVKAVFSCQVSRHQYLVQFFLVQQIIIGVRCVTRYQSCSPASLCL